MRTVYCHIIMLALSLNVSKVERPKILKITVFDVTLSFDALSRKARWNVRIIPTLPEIRVLGLHFCRCSMALSSFKFSWWARKKRILKQRVIAVQGHPRSLISVPRVISGNLGPTFQRYYGFSAKTAALPLFHLKVGNVPCYYRSPMLELRGAKIVS